MPDFVTLSCPTCGGKLEITNDVERFACAHCGNEHLVKRAGGLVSISPVVEGLRRVQLGVDKTAAELAIRRLKEDLDAIEREYALLKSELAVFRFDPIINLVLAGRKREIQRRLLELDRLAEQTCEELRRQEEIVMM